MAHCHWSSVQTTEHEITQINESTIMRMHLCALLCRTFTKKQYEQNNYIVLNLGGAMA